MSEPAAEVTNRLRYLSWEITGRCDARCVHCYVSAGPECSTESDLSTDEALSLIDQLAEGGQMILAFSGGEPLIRPDWRRLMQHAVDRDLIVTLITNGSQVDDSAADFLAELGTPSITVSLDSHRPEVHDRIRGLEGLHTKALGGIRRLAERGVRVIVNFTPIQQNWRDVRGVVELAYQLGASSVSLSDYAPAGRGTREMALSGAEREELVTVWLELAREYADRLQLLADNRVVSLISTGSSDPCPDCGAGRVMARITSAGELTPCGFSPESFGSIRTVPFPELWELSRDHRRSIEGADSCGTCSMLIEIGA